MNNRESLRGWDIQYKVRTYEEFRLEDAKKSSPFTTDATSKSFQRMFWDVVYSDDVDAVSAMLDTPYARNMSAGQRNDLFCPYVVVQHLMNRNNSNEKMLQRLIYHGFDLQSRVYTHHFLPELCACGNRIIKRYLRDIRDRKGLVLLMLKFKNIPDELWRCIREYDIPFKLVRYIPAKPN